MANYKSIIDALCVSLFTLTLLFFQTSARADETQNEIQTKKLQKDTQRLMEKLKELQIKYAAETKKVFELQKKIKGSRYNDSPPG